MSGGDEPSAIPGPRKGEVQAASAGAPSNPSRRRRRVGCAVVGLVLVGTLLFSKLRYLLPLGPGGLPPMYPAVDHDWYLTRKAASARPLIEALERYRREHQAYPRDATALVPYVDCPGAEPLRICDWSYWSDGAGYGLARKLGWDPSLHFSFDGFEGTWVFDPGDGSPEKEIVLEP